MKITPAKVIARAKHKANELVHELAVAKLLRIKGRQYKNHPDNNLRLVAQGFADRQGQVTDDSIIFKRIISAYKKSQIGQQNADANYKVSSIWLPIYESRLADIMQALQAEDVPKIQRLYQNFMRNACSSGLVGLQIEMENQFFRSRISTKNKKRFLYDFLHRIELWQSLLGKTHGVEDLEAPDIGNPYGYFINGRFVKTGADYLHYYATAIARLVRSKRHSVVVELGGGYGGMAYYLLRDNNRISYIDFDLPENMALTAYYLLKAFPEKKILLFGEADFDFETFREHDIVLMPSFVLPELPDCCADVTFNSYSLAEMSPETVRTYVSQLSRITRDFLLHVNHTQLLVKADDFGFDPAQFDLMYKVPALWNGGRDLQPDEYEYLYRKSERQAPP